LKQILRTDKRVDQRAVEEGMDQKCADLRANADSILAAMAKRRSKHRKVVASVIMGFLILGTFLTAELYKATTHGFEALGKKTAPMVEQAKKKTQKVFQKGSNAETNTVAATTTETNTVQDADAPVKTPMVVKGNRPVLGRWHGWKNEMCTIPDAGAFQRLFVGEFNDMIRRIRDNGIPFAQQFDPAKTSRMVSRAHKLIHPESVNGEKAAPFYINRGTQDYNEMMSDILNYHMNIGDVLNGLPVAQERMPDAQVAVMEAVGPAMGWSVAQQKAQQKQDPQAEQAYQTILKGAQAFMTQQKADTNDVESVFWATVAATRDYRQTHPDNNYLLLLTDRAIRETAGIEIAKTTEYAQLSKQDRQEAAAYIAQADAETRQAYASQARPPQQKAPKEKSYKWYFITIGAGILLGSWLTSAFWKERNKVVR